MRGIVLIILLLLSVSGGAVFHVKYQVAQLADQLKAVEQQKVSIIENLHLLQAEWAYLNEPARLEMLAQKYLPLIPSETRQIISLPDASPPLTSPQVRPHG